MFFSNGEWEWSKKPPSVNSIIGEIFPPIPFRQTLQNCSPIWSKFTYIPFNPGKSYTYFNQSRQGFHIFSIILARVSHIFTNPCQGTHIFTNPCKGYIYFHYSWQGLQIFQSFLAWITHTYFNHSWQGFTFLTNLGQGYTFFNHPGKGFKFFNQSWQGFHIFNQSWQRIQIV